MRRVVHFMGYAPAFGRIIPHSGVLDRMKIPTPTINTVDSAHMNQPPSDFGIRTSAVDKM
jgi:hypothetical protein